MTEIIIQALEMTGQRGIINKGWGGLGNCKYLNFLVVTPKKPTAIHKVYD